MDYFEDVKKIIARQFELDEDLIEEESQLGADLNISELDMEDLIATLEEKYQIEIPQDQYSTFNQVSDIVTYLYENIDRAWKFR